MALSTLLATSAGAQEAADLGEPEQSQVQDALVLSDALELDDDISSPLAVAGVRSVATGSRHTCAISGRGNVWCWGGNYDGQVGDGTTYYGRSTPVRVIGLEGALRRCLLGGTTVAL